jgi:hypothetical protein
VVFDRTIPAGYTVSIDQGVITNANKAAVSFTFASAEVGADYSYAITSSGGGTPVNGSGVIASAGQQVTGINVTGLGDGTLTLSATLTDPAGNAGSAASDTVAKDATAPSGYTVSIDQAWVNNANKAAVSFTFASAEVGASYSWSISSSGGGTPVNGSGTIALAGQQVTGINVTALADGTLTLSATLTDSVGNPGSPVTDTVGKDVAAPTITAVTMNNNPNKNRHPVVDFSEGVYGNASASAAIQYNCMTFTDTNTPETITPDATTPAFGLGITSGTFDLTWATAPTTGDVIAVNVALNMIFDAAGNPMAAGTYSQPGWTAKMIRMFPATPGSQVQGVTANFPATNGSFPALPAAAMPAAAAPPIAGISAAPPRFAGGPSLPRASRSFLALPLSPPHARSGVPSQAYPEAGHAGLTQGIAEPPEAVIADLGHAMQSAAVVPAAVPGSSASPPLAHQPPAPAADSERAPGSPWWLLGFGLLAAALAGWAALRRIRFAGKHGE